MPSLLSDEALVDDGAAGLVDHVVAGVLGVPGLPRVADLHGGAPIVTVSRVLHILDTTVGKGDLIFPNDVAVLVTRPLLAEVSVVFVVMDSVLEVEGVGLLVITSVVTAFMDPVMDLGDHGGAVH